MNKKINLIIVEGISEKNALEGIFKVILKADNEIEMIVYDGDILTSLDPIHKTIEKCNSVLSKNGFDITDINKIIQISDLDGCYIDDANIIQKASGDIEYHDSTIECVEVKSIKTRNKNKVTSIKKLKEISDIEINGTKVPYKIYFMSCNLEHVLYDKRSLNKRQKSNDAIIFSLSYENREHEFIDFIKIATLGKNENELWEHVKKNNNSLQMSSTMYFIFE